MSIATQRQREAAKRLGDGWISYEEFLARPESEVIEEWVDGKVVAMAPVSDAHTELGAFLIAILQQFVEAHGAGRLLYEPFQMKTGPKLPGRSPDIFIVRKENLRRIKKTHLEGPADLV